MKLIAPIFAVWPGEVYPREIPAGEECPADLEQAAREAGALDDAESKPRRARKAADE